MYNAMTDTAIRKALKILRKNRDEGRDAQEAQIMIDGMIDELIRRNNDPYTTAADIRYFESEEGETDCVTGCDPAEYEDEDWSDQSAYSYTL
jgi:hypothetical protein